MKPKSILPTVLFALLPLLGVAQSTISVNFDGQAGTGTPGPVTGVAGAVPAANWNNTGSSALAGPLALVDDTGAPTGASVNWSVGNQWTTSGSDTGGTDAQMMQGYLDNFHTRPPMTVTGIPAEYQASGYNLLIYHNTDSGGTMGFTVDDGVIPATTYFSHQAGGNNTNYPLAGVDPFGGAAGYIGSQDTASGTTTPSNYTLFEGLSGATLTITGVQGTAGDGRSRPNGFQIVAQGVAEDSDGDGLPDAWETQHNLDPNDNGAIDPANGADGDPDGDNLANIDEFNRRTDPQDDDSDDDGLTDGDEVNTYGTNALLADTDDDGRSDGEEVNGPITSDPNLPDTDGDGFEDGVEIAAGTNPNDPNDHPELLPIGYWSFDDLGGGGGTTTADLSPGGNDGTVMGDPEIVPGACGADGDFAIKFDGVDDFVTTGVSLLNGLTEFTMAGWVKWETAQTANRIGWYGQNDAVEYGLINPTTAHHWANVGGAYNVTVPAVNPDWTHFVVTGNAAGRRAYVNGVDQGTTGSSIVGSGSAFPFNIGGGGVFDAAGNFFTGCIDEVAVWDVVLTDAQILQLASCELTPLGPRAPAQNPLGLNVQNVGGQLEISWNSVAGNLYDLLSDLDLEPEIASWEIWDGNEMIPATPPRNTLSIPFPADDERYFAIREYPTPPTKVFSDDFEGGQGLWTTGTLTVATATEWELGTPTAGVLVGPPAANSGANCFGTDLGAQYVEDTSIFLRSPAIDLSVVVSATLIYQRWIDIEATFDSGSVRVLDAADDSEIAVLEDVIEGTSSAWEVISLDLPPEALGKTVKIEFRFTCDNFGNQAGFYVDDVCVEGSAP